MFPFNLAGPSFLAFYALFAATVLIAYALWLRALGAPSGRDGSVTLDALTADPYRIACLRAGPDEAVKLAVVNLIDRDLLTHAKGTGWRATLKGDPGLQRRSLDRVVLGQCKAAPLSADEILADRTVQKAAAEIEADLQAKGLLFTTAQRARRHAVRRGVILLLAGVAGLRIIQALFNGQHNIGFLILLAAVACIMPVLTQGRFTRQGRRALDSVTALMARLKGRADRLVPGGATNEVVLYAAVFGLYALPATTFAYVEQTFPRPRDTSGSGSSGSDSSSSSSDGGSSCGGGGGGCGGCGGGGGGD